MTIISFISYKGKIKLLNLLHNKRRLEYFSRRLFIYIKLKGLEINVYLGFRLSTNNFTQAEANLR